MICNISFLQEQCDNDTDMVNVMIEMFIETAPKYVEAINNAFTNNDMAELRASAHGYLSSLKIIGAASIVEIVQGIENKVMDNDYSDLTIMVPKVIELTSEAISELQNQ